MDKGLLVTFLLISLVHSFRDRSFILRAIEEIGLNLPDFPKGYTHPAKWVRNFFGIRLKYIPQYFYFELIFSMFCILLGPIYIFIYAISGFSANVATGLIALNIYLILLDTIILLCVYYRMKRKVKIQKKLFIKKKHKT